MHSLEGSSHSADSNCIYYATTRDSTSPSIFPKPITVIAVVGIPGDPQQVHNSFWVGVGTMASQRARPQQPYKLTCTGQLIVTNCCIHDQLCMDSACVQLISVLWMIVNFKIGNYRNIYGTIPYIHTQCNVFII